MVGANPRVHQVKALLQARAGNGATELSVTEKECARTVAQIQVEPRTSFALSQGKTFRLGRFLFCHSRCCGFFVS